MNIIIILDGFAVRVSTGWILLMLMIPIHVIIVVIIGIRCIIRDIKQDKHDQWLDEMTAEDTKEREEILANGGWYCESCKKLNNGKMVQCTCGAFRPKS